MVHTTKFLFRIKAHQLGQHLKRQFIDRLRVYVKSGNGGTGIPRLGGIGGDGGDVIIKARNDITLRNVYSQNLKKRYIAEHGANSKKLKLYGSKGNDAIIEVPCGVTAITDSGVVLGEVNAADDVLVIAKGGKGASTLNDYKPSEGQAFSVNLDLKLIADVGLIGIADLPGIIEGAHENRGMGHKFLKHISRTKINLFLIDINGFQLNYKFNMRSAFETMVFLNKELELYDNNLIDKPSILVLNKMDVEHAAQKYDEFMKLYENYENSLQSIEEYWRPTKRVDFLSIFRISAKTNSNVEDLCLELRDLIDDLDDVERPQNDVATKRREENADGDTSKTVIV